MRVCSFFFSTVGSVVRHPAWIICTLIVGCFATTPVLSPTAMPSSTAEDHAYYADLYESSHSRLTTGGYVGASEYELALFEEEDAALGHIVNAETPKERFAALSEYAAAQLKCYESGNLVGGEKYSFEAKIILYDSLSRLNAPEEYSTSSEMPGLNYLSFVLARNSSLFWLLPFVISCMVVFSLMRRAKLMGMAPVSVLPKVFVGVFSAFVLGVISIALALAPASIAAAVQNGIGDCAYPVVYTQNGQVMQSTLFATLLKQAALLLLSGGFIAFLAIAFNWVFDNPLIGSAIALSVCLVPTIAGYTGVAAEGWALQSVLPYLPTTYLSFGSITGYPGAFQSVEVLSIPGASFELGIIVMLASTFVVAFAGWAATIVKRIIGQVRRGSNA